MPNEVQTTTPTKNAVTVETCSLEQLLQCNTVKGLARSLKLSDVQLAKANNAILSLATDEKLKGTSNMSKVRFAYSVASLNYKNNNAIAPIKYGNDIQAQMQYQAYIEDMIECGHVKETNAVVLYEGDGIDYKPHINKWGFTELTLPNIIEQKSLFEKPKEIGYYAYAICDDGRVATCVLSKDQVKAHAQRYSKAYGANFSPWVSSFNQMALKTVIKDVARTVLKWFPFDRLAKSISLDQMVFDEDGQSYKDRPVEASTTSTETKSNVKNTIVVDAETGEVEEKK